MPSDRPHLVQEDTGEHHLLRPRTTLGRSPDSDVVLADASCSAHHAILRADPEGWIVEDLGSTNGTWVNGNWVQGTHPVREGDLLQLGNLRFRAREMSLRVEANPLAAPKPGPTVIMPPPAKAEPLVPLAEPAQASKRRPLFLLAGAGALAVAAGTVALVYAWHRVPSGTGTQTGTAAGPETAKGKPKLPPKLDLLREATLFRDTATGRGLPEAIERHGGEKSVGVITESQVFRKAPAIWSYFFSGTVILGGHMESPKPVVAYYNPYLDGVLLTQWEVVEGKALIRSTDLRIGSRMAGQATLNPKLAWWVAELGKRPLPEAMTVQYAAFLKAFARDYPAESVSVISLTPGPDLLEVRTIIERQAVASFANLAALQNPKAPTYMAELSTFRQALRSGDAPMLERVLPARNPLKAGVLASQPGWVRRDAVPIYALAGAKRTIVLLAPVSGPRFCLMTARGTPPTSTMEQVIPFDMDGGLTPAPRKVSGRGGKP